MKDHNGNVLTPLQQATQPETLIRQQELIARAKDEADRRAALHHLRHGHWFGHTGRCQCGLEAIKYLDGYTGFPEDDRRPVCPVVAPPPPPPNPAWYDSRPDTHEHIHQVRLRLHRAIDQLLARAVTHDRSKLVEPELSGFDRATPALATLAYGSPEYEAARAALGYALEHHYARNRHHPEWHKDGVRGMTLVDLIEMLCDWAAAVERHTDKPGHILKSIEFGRARFGYGDELARILTNTAREMLPDDWARPLPPETR